jgi:hypothetical protein
MLQCGHYINFAVSFKDLHSYRVSLALKHQVHRGLSHSQAVNGKMWNALRQARALEHNPLLRSLQRHSQTRLY